MRRMNKQKNMCVYIYIIKYYIYIYIGMCIYINIYIYHIYDLQGGSSHNCLETEKKVMWDGGMA